MSRRLGSSPFVPIADTYTLIKHPLSAEMFLVISEYVGCKRTLSAVSEKLRSNIHMHLTTGTHPVVGGDKELYKLEQRLYRHN